MEFLQGLYQLEIAGELLAVVYYVHEGTELKRGTQKVEGNETGKKLCR